MSLEYLAAGMFALRGLSLLSNLVRGSEALGTEATAESGDPISQAEFEAILDSLIEAAQETSGNGADPHAVEGDAEALVAALAKSERGLAPLLFRTLDADGNGMLEDGEIEALEHLVSDLQRALPADVWTDLPTEVTSLAR